MSTTTCSTSTAPGATTAAVVPAARYAAAVTSAYSLPPEPDGPGCTAKHATAAVDAITTAVSATTTAATATAEHDATTERCNSSDRLPTAAAHRRPIESLLASQITTDLPATPASCAPAIQSTATTTGSAIICTSATSCCSHVEPAAATVCLAASSGRHVTDIRVRGSQSGT